MGSSKIQKKFIQKNYRKFIYNQITCEQQNISNTYYS